MVTESATIIDMEAAILKNAPILAEIVRRLAAAFAFEELDRISEAV